MAAIAVACTITGARRAGLSLLAGRCVQLHAPTPPSGYVLRFFFSPTPVDGEREWELSRTCEHPRMPGVPCTPFCIPLSRDHVPGDHCLAHCLCLLSQYPGLANGWRYLRSIYFGKRPRDAVMLSERVRSLIPYALVAAYFVSSWSPPLHGDPPPFTCIEAPCRGSNSVAKIGARPKPYPSSFSAPWRCGPTGMRLLRIADDRTVGACGCGMDR